MNKKQFEEHCSNRRIEALNEFASIMRVGFVFLIGFIIVYFGFLFSYALGWLNN